MPVERLATAVYLRVTDPQLGIHRLRSSVSLRYALRSRLTSEAARKFLQARPEAAQHAESVIAHIGVIRHLAQALDGLALRLRIRASGSRGCYTVRPAGMLGAIPPVELPGSFSRRTSRVG